MGRLALRVEGDLWNAYYAQQGTMDGAFFLGSIRIGAVTNSPKRKQAFMDLMTDLVGEYLRDATGLPVAWGKPHAGPESERGGNA